MSLDMNLLDSMLSSDIVHRRRAESHYVSMCRIDRMRGLTRILMQCDSAARNDGDANDDDCGRMISMAAVLLRREMMAGGGGGLNLDDETNAVIMEIAMPLLELFRVEGGRTKKGNARRQLGHCIAELCRVASGSTTTSTGDDIDGGWRRGYVVSVLTDIGSGVSCCCCCIFILLFSRSCVGKTYPCRSAYISFAPPFFSPVVGRRSFVGSFRVVVVVVVGGADQQLHA